jgi:hypothetical protein
MDHGVATFPPDGDQSDLLIRVADERLYRLKHADHSRTGSRGSSQSSSDVIAPATSREPISIESRQTPEKSPAESPIATASATHPLTNQTLRSADSPSSYAVQRKAERVSMVGTNAYAVIGERGDRRARVVDLGFGGVALELEQAEELSESILAILHVPILPPVRVYLKPVWSRRTSEGAFRLGCHFIS